MSDEPNYIFKDDGSGKNVAKKEKKRGLFAPLNPSELIFKLRIEKKGRGGKSVTVIYNIPNNPPEMKKLTKEIKAKCGTGGTLKEDQIEIQGDKREVIRDFLIKKGFQVKGY